MESSESSDSDMDWRNEEDDLHLNLWQAQEDGEGDLEEEGGKEEGGEWVG